MPGNSITMSAVAIAAAMIAITKMTGHESVVAMRSVMIVKNAARAVTNPPGWFLMPRA